MRTRRLTIIFVFRLQMVTVDPILFEEISCVGNVLIRIELHLACVSLCHDQVRILLYSSTYIQRKMVLSSN